MYHNNPSRFQKTFLELKSALSNTLPSTCDPDFLSCRSTTFMVHINGLWCTVSKKLGLMFSSIKLKTTQRVLY